MYKLEKIAPATYKLPKEGKMLVDGLIIGDEKLLTDPEMQKPFQQVANVACLPGIVGYSIAMPDIHWGYGFPIGGVAATDAATGVISPGGVGYDINCGVRLALAPIVFKSMSLAVKKSLIEAIFQAVPSGVGHGHRGEFLSEENYRQIAKKGAAWSVEKGFGLPEDLDHTESHGFIAGADISAVSPLAKERGARQLGSIGSGNHFIEIGEIENILLPEVASAWGLEKGNTYILIHSGSRGFGHQICQDYLDTFIKQGYSKNLPDAQLVAAPLQSQLGKQYWVAMSTAANYAFNNRQQILHQVRHCFMKQFKLAPEQIRLLYDVCHNIAKIETHGSQTLCVHRKGATRAFGPGHPELSPLFKQTGQPVLVPGDMARASYVMVGLGNPLTFCSCCHGAGREKSRNQSLKEWQSKDLERYMASQGIIVKASSFKTVAEEMPDAYKFVGDVVKSADEAKLAKIVAELKPAMVVKG